MCYICDAVDQLPDKLNEGEIASVICGILDAYGTPVSRVPLLLTVTAAMYQDGIQTKYETTPKGPLQ